MLFEDYNYSQFNKYIIVNPDFDVIQALEDDLLSPKESVGSKDIVESIRRSTNVEIPAALNA